MSQGMTIKTVRFVKSSVEHTQAPAAVLPEYAFIGRSNVGKSALINMLMQRKKLAKTSSTPGKTQLINHFLVNDNWYLVDLPGYGYAKVPKALRSTFMQQLSGYLSFRTNLINTFLLVDSRHEPQANDLEVMRTLGKAELPFSIVFTKVDKLSSNKLQQSLARYHRALSAEWEESPPMFFSSAETGQGREEILGFIDRLNGVVDYEQLVREAN